MRLGREIELVRRHVPDDHRVEQLHFGGGTPTYLDDAQLEALFAGLRERFHLTAGDDRDFSIEIDPRTVDGARIHRLAALGINRVSLGMQDFDPAVQRAVNRIQSVDKTRAIIDGRAAVRGEVGEPGPHLRLAAADAGDVPRDPGRGGLTTRWWTKAGCRWNGDW